MDILLPKTEQLGSIWDLQPNGLWKLKNSSCGVFTDNPSRIVNIKIVEDEFVDKSKIVLREISRQTAKEMIVKNHYSHTWTMCSVALGVFYKTKESSSGFFENDCEKLIGCIVYGSPVGRSAVTSISDSLKYGEVYELTRLWIADLPSCKNIESYCIGRSFDWLRKNRPQIKALLSYADNEAGHVGTIYQSTNWLYQGNSQLKLMPTFSISLSGPTEGYEWIHSRTSTEKFGSQNVDSLKKVIGKTFYRKLESSKHRYIYILLTGKERKKLIKNLKHPLYPYPKTETYHEQIEEIVVDKDEKTDNPFFIENT